MGHRKDNIEMICSVGELSALFKQSHSIAELLQSTVRIVANHMQAAVCSIYLLEETSDELILRATQGLNPNAIDRVRLKSGEGLTGLALQQLRPIREGRGSHNPHFKFFPDTNEERYEAFLAVPITQGLNRIGVLVVQDPAPDYFDEHDTLALRAIASQLATIIENARLLMTLHQPLTEEPTEEPSDDARFLRGKPASPGIAYGQARFMDQRSKKITARPPLSLEDFEHALDAAETELQGLQDHLEDQLADVASMIFTAQLMMLRDENFSGAMSNAIQEGTHPLDAVQSITDRYCRLFSASPNPRLQEKVQDVSDLGLRLADHLLHNNDDGNHAAYQNAIIVAHDLLPSDILKLSIQGAEGLVLTGGGMTAHVSILARSLNLPMVIVESTRTIKPDTPLLLDANQGTLFIDPDNEIQTHYAAQKEAAGAAGQIGEQVQPETFTRDGTRVQLLANINLISELGGARDLKAEGIGLYRTEFPFIIRTTFPSEEEQCHIYRRVFDGMPEKSVTFRTLDIGGDKMLSYFPQNDESNPFLGLRAIRFSLRHRDIFRQQLNALLRAGHERDLRIMFPLIASVDDFIQAREVVEECLKDLAERGEPHNTAPHIGAMIELPSAVAMAEDLAREADFLSIGTNDLVQYVLAVDRTNEQLSEWYQHYHPAVLRALAWIARSARKHTQLSICGDIATDASLLPFLVGIGLRSFSMTPHAIPSAQQSLRKINVAEAQKLAQRLLSMNRLQDIANELGTTTI